MDENKEGKVGNGTGREEKRAVCVRLRSHVIFQPFQQPVLLLLETTDSHGESLFLCTTAHLVWVVPKLSSTVGLMTWSKPIGAFIPIAAVTGSGAGTWHNWANEMQA